MTTPSQSDPQHRQVPQFIRAALYERGLMPIYDERSVAERNDYVAWIMESSKMETRLARLDQMLRELDLGSSRFEIDAAPAATARPES